MTKFSHLILITIFLTVCAWGQDTRLQIIEQPRPELPQNHMTMDVQGTVVLKVEFLDSGEIGDVSAVKSMPLGLTERAMAAARRIRFSPEKKDGKPVTIVKELEYFYSWNGGWRLPADSVRPDPLTPVEPGKAEAIIARAVQKLGGDRYLHVRSQVGRGKFSLLREGGIASFQSFIDITVFPDKERTDFKGQGSHTSQANTGDTGWIFDGDQDIIKIQNANQIANFKQGLRTSLDNLLRGGWKGEAELTYGGRRQAGLGKRNDVVRLTYKDGFVVEFEFSDDGLPQKAIYSRTSGDGEVTKDEDRYAQFIEVGGILTPFIIDRFSNGAAASRINYDTVEFDRPIPDSVFAKPTSPKEAKKEVKLN